ncbi:MAG: PorP/SprF family type IX secretion system membrane protein, partial [Flavobacteriales bacterium]
MWLLKSSLRLIGLWLFFMLGYAEASAQHQPVLSQYMLNSLPLNPAFSGSRESMSFAASYRNQWTGFDGAPTTSTFAVHSPLRKESFALGMVVHRDELGVSRTSGFQFVAAYRMRLGNGKLSFGLSGGMTQTKNNWSEIITTEDADIAFSSGDQVNWNPDFGTGLYYYNQKYYVSLSVPTLIKASYVNGDGYVASFQPSASNFYLNSGMNINVNSSWQFKPSFMLRYHRDSAFAVDFN